MAEQAKQVSNLQDTNFKFKLSLQTAVPTHVVSLQVIPLSLHQIQVSWQPPEIPNGILTGYEVTVHSTKLNYTQSISVGPNVLNIIVSDNIGNDLNLTMLMINHK